MAFIHYDDMNGAKVQRDHLIESGYRAADFAAKENPVKTWDGSRGMDIMDGNALGEGYRFEALQGDDQIIGSKFDDIINGGDGNDQIVFGGGRDFAIGGDGKDQFVIDLASLRAGDVMTIADFQDVGDTIVFRNIDPHASMTQGIDGSIQVWADTLNGGRQVVASLMTTGNEIYQFNNNMLSVVG